MKISVFLGDLSRQGVHLQLLDGRLKVIAPKGVLTQEQLDEIRRRKPEIISFLSRADSVESSQTTSIEPVQRDGELHLSFAQQRAWYLEQLQPGCPMHNLPGGWKLNGPLDIELLQKAITEIHRRHEILRCCFGTSKGRPTLTISPLSDFELEVEDLRHIADPEERNTELLARIAAEVEKPFDLARGGLFRIRVYRTGDSEHALFLMPHHIVWDAWSFDIFLFELSEIYRAFSKGERPQVPDLPVQYVDYAAWEHQLLSGDALAGNLAYWTKQLGGELPVLDMPTDFPRPQMIRYRGTSEVVDMPDAIVAKLKDLSRDEHATIFMTTLAAISVILCRYSGQKEVIVGCPIENTTKPEIEPLIGYFVNMLALRNPVDLTKSFRDLLRKVRETCLDAFSHQDLPFERIVDLLKIPRDTSRTPVFQAIFLYQDASERPHQIGDAVLSQFNVPMGSSQTDVHFWLKQQSDRWLLGLDYSTDLFEARTVQRLLRHLRRLLDLASSQPDAPLAELEFISADERHELLLECNDSSRPLPDAATIHQLFERQAKLSPESIAVRSREGSMTYRQLEERSNQIARHLMECGVSARGLVGICLPRTEQLLAGLLGILKTGAAYLPLDPEFPPERLAFMLSDGGVGVVLTHTQLLNRLPAFQGRTICLDKDDPGIRKQDRPAILSPAKGEDIAYVIYTSGSTGVPKGVEVSHANAVNFLGSMATEPGLSAADTLLAITTLSFDIALLELLLPVTQGGQVYIASREVTGDGKKLAALIREVKPTIMQATPATWRLLFESGWQGSPSLKVLCGGEALTLGLAQKLARSCPEVWNLYGPTETTVWSSCWKVSKNPEYVRIGRPIGNTLFYVLDEFGKPVPYGVTGELYIGGLGVAKGYRNRPELTKERFLPDPFRSEPGARMYRTGDAVRFRSNGELEYLSRLDQQVKIRGFRIELGEIESALVRCPGIQQAVVAAREYQPGDTRLVAYVTGVQAQETAGLRELLRERLPEYMVPSLFVRLEDLPLTPNGKIDRRALPAPESSLVEKPINDTPKNAAEVQIAKLWEQILLRPVSVTDDFFAIGGNSLLAAQLFALIEDVLGVQLPLATLFRASTVRQLALVLREAHWAPSWDSLVPIQPAGSKPPFYCVHGAGGNVLLYRGLAMHLGPDQPLYGLQSRGLDGKTPFLTSFEDMAREYIREIKQIQPNGPYYLGGYCLGGAIAYEMAQQLTAQGDEVGLLVFFETYNIKKAKLDASLSQSAVGLAQNVVFHLSNALALQRGARRVFIAEKMKVAKRRLLRDWLGPVLDVARKLHLARKQEQQPFVRLGKVNDRVQLKYEPKPYSGKTLLFKPNRTFVGFSDPKFGWGELIPQLSICVLPISPRGMLVEPFVESVAQLLRTHLDETVQGGGDLPKAVDEGALTVH